MNTQNAITPRTSHTVPVTGTWEIARHWLIVAQRCEQLKLFSQVMLGFELQRLHAEHGIQNGSKAHLSHDGKGQPRDWETILQDETGLAQSTAYRFMDMAKAAAPRLKSIPALKGFDPAATPIAALPASTGEALQKAVKKLTDGLTQKEFGEQCGLWKKPPGNPNAKGGPRSAAPATPEAIEAYKLQTLRQDLPLLLKSLSALGPRFLIAQDPDLVSLQSLRSLCERQAKALASWLDVAPAHRTPALAAKIEALFR